MMATVFRSPGLPQAVAQLNLPFGSKPHILLSQLGPPSSGFAEDFAQYHLSKAVDDAMTGNAESGWTYPHRSHDLHRRSRAWTRSTETQETPS